MKTTTHKTTQRRTETVLFLPDLQAIGLGTPQLAARYVALIRNPASGIHATLIYTRAKEFAGVRVVVNCGSTT